MYKFLGIIHSYIKKISPNATKHCQVFNHTVVSPAYSTKPSIWVLMFLQGMVPRQRADLKKVNKVARKKEAEEVQGEHN